MEAEQKGSRVEVILRDIQEGRIKLEEVMCTE